MVHYAYLTLVPFVTTTFQFSESIAPFRFYSGKFSVSRGLIAWAQAKNVYRIEEKQIC